MEYDFLVVGSGIAGLSFAIKVAELGSVLLVTKKDELNCATNLAQGGIAAVLSSDDSFELHMEDTFTSGAGICDPEVVKLVVTEGPKRIAELVEYGVDFVREEHGKSLSLGKEGGHSKRRVAHAYDLTGREIERALLEKCKSLPNVTILQQTLCVDLIMSGGKRSDEGGRCLGAYLWQHGRIEPCRAKTTVLCTGGAGKVYLYTSNPDIATGDGIAMAFRAGAQIANMEFIQFHPTCLYHPEAKNFLISEAVRGEGALLVDGMGQRFMQNYDKVRMELATRDTVARAIDSEMKRTGADCVYLDITSKGRDSLKKRFPTIYNRCLELGIDIAVRPIPVVPAAHYVCGGVLTDTWGNTSIPGLMALGETACTGLHGGNRLASNSLLEAVVYAERAAHYCRHNQKESQDDECIQVDTWKKGAATDLDEEILINHNWDFIRRIMWNYVGIVRSKRRLDLAAQRLSEIMSEIEQHYRDYTISPNMIELRNIAIVANLIVSSAIMRHESRGLHYLKEFPNEDENQRSWNVLTRSSHSRASTPWAASLYAVKKVA